MTLFITAPLRLGCNRDRARTFAPDSTFASRNQARANSLAAIFRADDNREGCCTTPTAIRMTRCDAVAGDARGARARCRLPAAPPRASSLDLDGRSGQRDLAASAWPVISDGSAAASHAAGLRPSPMVSLDETHRGAARCHPPLSGSAPLSESHAALRLRAAQPASLADYRRALRGAEATPCLAALIRRRRQNPDSNDQPSTHADPGELANVHPGLLDVQSLLPANGVAQSAQATAGKGRPQSSLNSAASVASAHVSSGDGFIAAVCNLQKLTRLGGVVVESSAGHAATPFGTASAYSLADGS